MADGRYHTRRRRMITPAFTFDCLLVDTGGAFQSTKGVCRQARSVKFAYNFDRHPRPGPLAIPAPDGLLRTAGGVGGVPLSGTSPLPSYVVRVRNVSWNERGTGLRI